MFPRESAEKRQTRRAKERALILASLAIPSRSLHRGTYEGATGEAVPKVKPIRSEEYRRAVASLPCINCCTVGHSQAAHPNTGKGGGTKTSDVDCFPLCADRPGVRGCHGKFDQEALFTKEKRRELEPLWGQQTRAVIRGMGKWPKGLEDYEVTPIGGQDE